MSKRDHYKYVYLCTDEAGLVKVGASHDPSFRRGWIEWETAKSIILQRKWHRPSDALDAETSTKRLLRKYSLGGEWFSCPLEVACIAVEEALKLLDAKDYILLHWNRRKHYGFSNPHGLFGCRPIPTVDNFLVTKQP